MIDVVVGHGSPLTRSMLRAALEDAGFSVRDASTAEAVVAACREHVPDVVVAGESLGVLAPIKQDPDLFTVAVVIVQRTTDAAEALRHLAEGAIDVILMPIRDADAVARASAAARTKALQEAYLDRGRSMEDLVYGDPLTGLYNRRFMFAQLDALVHSAERHRRDLSLCLLDLDHFKAVNDDLGHPGGDAALVETAARLGRRVRREDFLGRIGGEELMVLLPDTSPQDAARVAEDLRAVISDTPLLLDGISRRLTASAGWATWRPGETAEQLVRRADEALYRAKAEGRDRVCAAAEASVLAPKT